MSGAPGKRRRLDSDDDDDDYAQPGRGSPLLAYAVTAALPTDDLFVSQYPEEGEEAVGVVEEKEGHVSSASSSGAAAAVDAALSYGATAALSTSPTQTPAPAGPPTAFEDDDDIPAEYKGLFSTELLNVLLVSMDAICKQSVVTDKVLAQYLPPRMAVKEKEMEDGDGAAAQQQSSAYRNAFGIAPGFRWDGVVRGRGPVD